MNISVISFTRQGRALAERIENGLPDRTVALYQNPQQGVAAWAGEQFAKKAALIFIGACGIAVRAIAPHIKDKLSDSPVLVLDERGRYVIPLLSGHVGGANELAELIADKIGAAAVITTATDINHRFAVDLFAVKNHLHILNPEGIAKVSAKVLRGEKISISIEEYDDRIKIGKSQLPEEIELAPYPPVRTVDVVISTTAEKGELSRMAVLRLKPKEYILGIGCKKGKKKEEISGFICRSLEKLGLNSSEVSMITSIDKKSREEGICLWAEENRISFVTFSGEKLKSQKGDFHGSAFVEQAVGVDNVCERAALFACGEGGRLVLEKQAEDGITLAVAKREWRIGWEW